MFQGGQSEVDKEQAKHEEQEENYSFVWGKNKQTGAQSPLVTGGGQVSQEVDTINTEYTTNTESQAGEYQNNVIETEENAESEDDTIKDFENL